MFCGEVRWSISDVLLLAVKRHLGVLAAKDSGWYYGDGSEKYASELSGEVREQYHDGFTRKSVRNGPLHGAFLWMQDVELLKRIKIKKAQRLFQKWVRMVGRALDCDIVIAMGSVDIVQVGSYFDSKVLVEEFSCGSYGGYVCGGNDKKNPAIGASLSFQGHVFQAPEEPPYEPADEYCVPPLLDPIARVPSKKFSINGVNGKSVQPHDGRPNAEESWRLLCTPRTLSCCFQEAIDVSLQEREDEQQDGRLEEAHCDALSERPSSSSRSFFLQTDSMHIGNDLDPSGGNINIRICSLHTNAKGKKFDRKKGESLFSRLNEESAKRLASYREPDLARVHSAIFDPLDAVVARSRRTRTDSHTSEI
jgi:hypothetical protein